MRTKLLLPVFFIVLAACNGGSETKPPKDGAPPQEDSYLQGQIDAFNFVLELATVVDSTGVLNPNFEGNNDLKSKLTGKRFCPCYPHDNGQAHVHQDKLLLTEKEKTPLVGMLKIYQKVEDGNGGYSDVPCYAFFINNTLKPLSDCQHISDTEGNAKYDFVCLNNKIIAYNLDPQDPTDHDHNADCH